MGYVKQVNFRISCCKNNVEPCTQPQSIHKKKKTKIDLCKKNIYIYISDFML